MNDVVQQSVPPRRARKSRRDKATILLSPRCSITVVAEELSFPTVIESLETALKEARKGSSLRLSTWLLVMEEMNGEKLPQ